MTISIKETLVEGTRCVYHNKKIIALLWCTNAAFAFVLTMPLVYTFLDHLDHSLMSDKLSQGFDSVWFAQLNFLYKTQLGELPLIIWSMVGIYTLMQTFFLGGLISIFNNRKKNHFIDFFYGGVKYWLRFYKILLISLIFYAVAFKINDYSGDLIAYLFKNSENELTDFILRSLRYILLIFTIGIISIVSDYAKVVTALEDRTKILKEILGAAKLIKSNFTKIFTVFFIVSLIGAMGAAVYNLFDFAIPRTPIYFLIISFVLQQLLIIFRLYIRMLFCSTEVILYKDLSAEVIPAKVKEEKPVGE